MSTMRAGVITVSDSRSSGQRQDTSGPAIVEILGHAGFEVMEQTMVPDVKEQIQDALVRLVHTVGVDLIVRVKRKTA